MLNLKKDRLAVTKIVLAMMVVAFVFSFMPHVFAQTAAPAVATQEYASFSNMSGIIKGSEKTPNISLGAFVVNIAKTTGIYAFFTNSSDKVTPAGDKIRIFGWMELL
ncbi:MAG: sodium ion-translocating decarboxylase subunit beta, partial [Treponemataceae bacterium]